MVAGKHTSVLPSISHLHVHQGLLILHSLIRKHVDKSEGFVLSACFLPYLEAFLTAPSCTRVEIVRIQLEGKPQLRTTDADGMRVGGSLKRGEGSSTPVPYPTAAANPRTTVCPGSCGPPVALRVYHQRKQKVTHPIS